MRHHLLDRRPVADDKALVLPLPFQDVALQVVAAGCGYAVQAVERIHEGGNAGIGRGLERRQVDLVQLLQAHVDRVVVAPRHRRAIGREVLGARHDGIESAQLAGLEAEHTRRGDARSQVGVFARAFHHPAPARIARHVDHGREGPVDAKRRGLSGGDARRQFDGRHVPRRRFAQRHREYGLVAVDDVKAEQQRNLQARLHGRRLDLARFGHALHVEHGAHAAGADVGQPVDMLAARGPSEFAARQLVQLADFFFQRHLAKQVVDLPVDGLVLGRSKGRRQQQAGSEECFHLNLFCLSS